MTIETDDDLRGLARAGKVVRLALREMKRRLEPGMTTGELDAIGAAVLEKHGARSAPQQLYDFPGVNCISVNEEAVHGIPGGRLLLPGDLVKLDVTAELDGYIADAAFSVPIPPVVESSRKIAECAQTAFWKAVALARAGQPMNQIGKAIETEARRQGFAVLRELHSHGVGRAIHEDPSIPQYYDPSLRTRFTEGLVVTVEPILSAGSGRVVSGSDGWTLSTADGSMSSHYEHTIVITRGKPIVVTAA